MQQKVLIAGGSRGLGRAAALSFRERGYLVDVAYHHSREAARELAALPGIRTFACDLATREGCRDFAAFARDGEARIAGVIVTSGRECYGFYDTASDEEIADVMANNLNPALYLSQYLRPDLLKVASETEISPVLLFVSSVWGQCGAAMETLYSTSKAALIGLGKSLAKELGPAGIRVNIIAPGPMQTAMLDRFSPEEIQEIVGQIPLGRLGTGEDFANLCLYLVAEDRYMTGQVLALNGGFYI